MPTLGNNQTTVKVQTEADNSGIKSTEQELSNLDKAQETSSKTGQAFGAALSGAGIAATGLIASLGLAATSALNQAGAYQQSRVSFETMLGSADKAKTLLKQMSDFAAQTPFQLPQVVEGGKNLLAFGVSMKDIIPTFTTLGNIAAGVGTDKLPNLINVFGQVKSAGRLMSQDLLQFTSMGIPIIDLLAQHFGTTSAKVRDLVQNGKVGFSDLQTSLELLGGPAGKWGDLMAKQSLTFNGTLSNVSDQLGRVLRQAVGIGPDGDVRKGSLFSVATDAANSLLTALAGASPSVDKFVHLIETNKTALYAMGGALATLVALAAGAFIAAFGGAIATMTLLAAAGAGMAALWESHRTVFFAVAGAIVGAFIPALIGLAGSAWAAAAGFVAMMIPLLPFIAAGAAVAGVAYLIYSNWGLITKTFNDVAKAVTGAVSQAWGFVTKETDKLVTWFKGNWPLLLAVFVPFIGIPVLIYQHWGQITAWFSKQLTSLGQAINSGVKAAGAFFMHLPETIAYGIGYAVGWLVKFTTQTLPQWYNDTVKFLDMCVKAYIKFYTVDIPNFIMGVINWFAQLPGRVGKAVSDMWTVSLAWFTRTGTDMGNTATSTVNNVGNWFAQLPGRVGRAVTDMWNGAMAFFRAFGSDAMNWANSVVNGIVNFFNSLPGKLGQAIKSAIASAKGELGKIGGAFGAGLSNALGFRAAGGPVRSGQGYIVGENGPEYFQPSGNGNIIPNGGGKGGNTITIGSIQLGTPAAVDRFFTQLNQDTVNLGKGLTAGGGTF